MNKPLRPVWGIFLILCGVVAVSLIAKALRPKEIVPWRTDFAAAKEEARREGKPVFAYFTASWCGPCQTMRHTTWADAGVEAALRDYVPVKIDVDRSPDLASDFRISAVPSFIVVGKDGEPRRQADGALPPGDMVAWLKR